MAGVIALADQAHGTPLVINNLSTEAIIRKQRHAAKKPEEQNLYEQWAPAK